METHFSESIGTNKREGGLIPTSDDRREIAIYSKCPEQGIPSVMAWLRKLSRILVGRVIGANMGFKLFVALRLEVAHHFIERFALQAHQKV